MKPRQPTHIRTWVFPTGLSRENLALYCTCLTGKTSILQAQQGKREPKKTFFLSALREGLRRRAGFDSRVPLHRSVGTFIHVCCCCSPGEQVDHAHAFTTAPPFYIDIAEKMFTLLLSATHRQETKSCPPFCWGRQAVDEISTICHEMIQY